MSTIQLDVSEIQSLKKRISKMIDEIDDCYREVNKISNQIDMKVKRRKDIDADLLQIKNDLKKQKEFLTQCEKLVGESINDFVEAEKIDHLPDLKFSVRSVGGNSNYKVNNAFANLLLGTGFVSLATLMKFFMRAKNVPDVVKIADYPSISEYINEKFPNLKNNSSTVVSAATVENREHGGAGRTFDNSTDIASNNEQVTNENLKDEQNNSSLPLSETHVFGDKTYKTLNLKGIEGFECDQHYWQKLEGATGMCTATAWALATNINRMNNGNTSMVKPTDNWADGKRQFTKPFELSEGGSTAERKMEVAYEELQKGNATWIRCNSKSGSSGHDVVAIGLVEGCDPSNLKPSDFLIIDPADGTIKTLASYKVKDGAASVCRYTG